MKGRAVTPTPEDIAAAAQAEEEARKQQDTGEGLDLLATAGDIVVDVASAAAGIVDAVGGAFGALGALGSAFDGL